MLLLLLLLLLLLFLLRLRRCGNRRVNRARGRGGASDGRRRR
jgi:hypothetical protein